MRYPPEHKQKTRKRLLDTSSILAKEKGFSSASVDDLMTAAGLTGGAFYTHFESKNALFSELIRDELVRSARMLSPREGQTSEDWIVHLLDAYLSKAHIQDPGNGCVIPALGAEIARADVEVRRSFEQSLNALHQNWAERVGDSDLAWATISQLVGTVLIARAMSTKSAAARVVDANRAHIELTATTGAKRSRASVQPGRISAKKSAKQH